MRRAEHLRHEALSYDEWARCFSGITRQALERGRHEDAAKAARRAATAAKYCVAMTEAADCRDARAVERAIARHRTKRTEVKR